MTLQVRIYSWKPQKGNQHGEVEKATLEQSNAVGSVGYHTSTVCRRNYILNLWTCVLMCPHGITGLFIKESETKLTNSCFPAVPLEIGAQEKKYSGGGTTDLQEVLGYLESKIQKINKDIWGLRD